MSRGGTRELRIIGGRWRSRRLRFQDVQGLRPTPDRVRETLYNWLQFEVPGRHVLDLFAGSGALGFEALSRGAASLTLLTTFLDFSDTGVLDVFIDESFVDYRERELGQGGLMKRSRRSLRR